MPRSPGGRLSIHSLCLPTDNDMASSQQLDDSTISHFASSSNSTAYASSVDEDETMSFTSGLSIDDPDVRIAAEALEDLRCEYSHDNSQAQAAHERNLQQMATDSDRHSNSSELFSRMTNYTIVSSAVKVYESGKSYSRGFKYGAEMVESVARPVVRRFEPLEGFALRQLDKLERKTSAGDLEKRNSIYSRPQMDSPDSQTSSRWHNVITNASGLTVAMSDESLKSLRYCLHWLQYANSHIEKAITSLHDLLDEPTQDISTSGSQSEAARANQRQQRKQFLEKMAATKADIVQTIRKVVDVISTYAGAALPEPARSHVRNYILILPSRWAQASSALPTSRRSSLGSEVDDSLADRDRANKILVLASEALQMLAGVMHVVGDTLALADGWVDRLGRRQVSTPAAEDTKMEVEYDASENGSEVTQNSNEKESVVTAREGEDQDEKDAVMSG